MVKVENSTLVKISAKGILTGIDETGITLEDVKDASEGKILFSELKGLIGKEITVAIQNKEVEE